MKTDANDPINEGNYNGDVYECTMNGDANDPINEGNYNSQPSYTR